MEIMDFLFEIKNLSNVNHHFNIADKFKLKFKRLFYAQGPEVSLSWCLQYHDHCSCCIQHFSWL